jgi:transketolase C-terminal domain/subunit
MEGSIGPVAGSSHHAMYYRMPGIKIFSPMTSLEYETCYQNFMKDDSVYYISEHRGSYNNTKEFNNKLHEKCDITLFAISITRFEAEKAKIILEEKDLKVNIIHLFQLKPFLCSDYMLNSLANSTYGGIVLDDDFEDGIGKNISSDLMLNTLKPVRVMGLKNKSAGFSKEFDNLPPSCEEIVEKVLQITTVK